MRMQGKTVLVAGAGDNMGRAIPRLCAREGASLVLVSRNAEALEGTARLCRDEGAAVEAMVGDLTTEEVAEAAVRRARSTFGGLDALVYVAGGAFEPKGELSMDPGHWDEVTRALVRGPYLLARAAEEALAARRGSITFVTAGDATRQQGSPAYAAGKGAVETFARSLARRLWSRHVRVNVVAPGLIWYPHEDLEPPADRSLDRYGAAVDVAYAVLYLASDEAAWVTGARLTVDGGDDVLLLPAERRRP